MPRRRRKLRPRQALHQSRRPPKAAPAFPPAKPPGLLTKMLPAPPKLSPPKVALAEAAVTPTVVPVLAVPKLKPPPPKAVPLEISGSWWLTRTGYKATCNTCKVPIPKYECRLIFCPKAGAHLRHKAPSYAYMHDRIKWQYHHIDAFCVPPPCAAVQEIRAREDIAVEIGFLPKAMAEDPLQYIRTRDTALNRSLAVFRIVGHRVAVPKAMLKGMI